MLVASEGLYCVWIVKELDVDVEVEVEEFGGIEDGWGWWESDRCYNSLPNIIRAVIYHWIID